MRCPAMMIRTYGHDDGDASTRTDLPLFGQAASE